MLTFERFHDTAMYAASDLLSTNPRKALESGIILINSYGSAQLNCNAPDSAAISFSDLDKYPLASEERQGQIYINCITSWAKNQVENRDF